MNEAGELDRKEAVPALIGDPDDFLFVAGLAGTAKDVGTLTQGKANAYMLAGAMGSALAMGLGLALAQPGKRVLVVTGDGELLMGLGSLATVAAMAPPNLAILCVDNGHYGETGYQITHTRLGTDLAKVADGAGLPVTRQVEREDQIAEAAAVLRESNGPAFVHLKVGIQRPPVLKRSLDAAATKTAFRQALLGTE